MRDRKAISGHSQLFRRETARHLRSIADEVIALYIGQHPSWLGTYMVPTRDELLFALETLAEAIEKGDVAVYRRLADAYAEDLLGSGMPPVAVLAAAELLYGTILRCLTPDQRDLAQDYIAAEQGRLQELMYERVILPAEQRGA